MFNMNDASAYKLENWRDPEILFGDVYEPFNLFRDMNEGLDEHLFQIERALISQNNDVNIMPRLDEEKEDAKCNPLATTQGIGNIDTVSDLDQLNKVDADDEKYVYIQNFDPEGPTIRVTRIRLERILKQREKRRIFLKLFPEYALPFKNRDKKIKYKTRSLMAKNRIRNGKGKFERAQIMQMSELHKDEVIKDTKDKRKRHA